MGNLTFYNVSSESMQMYVSRSPLLRRRNKDRKRPGRPLVIGSTGSANPGR